MENKNYCTDTEKIVAWAFKTSCTPEESKRVMKVLAKKAAAKKHPFEKFIPKSK